MDETTTTPKAEIHKFGLAVHCTQLTHYTIHTLSATITKDKCDQRQCKHLNIETQEAPALASTMVHKHLDPNTLPQLWSITPSHSRQSAFVFVWCSTSSTHSDFLSSEGLRKEVPTSATCMTLNINIHCKKMKMPACVLYYPLYCRDLSNQLQLLFTLTKSFWNVWFNLWLTSWLTLL